MKLNSRRTKLLSGVSAVVFATLTTTGVNGAQAAERGIVEPVFDVPSVDELQVYQANGVLVAPSAEFNVVIDEDYVAEQERLKQEAEAAKRKQELESQTKDSSSSESVSIAAPMFTGGGSKVEWMQAAGIAESDYQFVDYIVQKESGWNPNAVNSSSGASGLVQALPCGKVPGSCFNPVDNLRWADSYAKSRYGSWSQAYNFWVANHWW